MLIESMLYSQIYKRKFETIASIQCENDQGEEVINIVEQINGKDSKSKKANPNRIVKSISKTINRQSDDNQGNIIPFSRQKSQVYKKNNPDFNYQSFLRLRNLFYLCLVLKNNPGLRKFRHHYLHSMAKRTDYKQVVEVETFTEMAKKKIFKRILNIRPQYPFNMQSRATMETSADDNLQVDESNDNIVKNDSLNYVSITTLPAPNQRLRRNSN
jgi:hypothetical protein